jgi:hypothetical protein
LAQSCAAQELPAPCETFKVVEIREILKLAHLLLTL